MNDQVPSQPRYSPDRRWYWNGFEWVASAGQVPGAPRRPTRRVAGPLIVLGAAIAAGAEVFAWSLPTTAHQLMVRQVASDPAAGPVPVAIVSWAFFAATLALAALANWLVWAAARRTAPQ